MHNPIVANCVETERRNAHRVLIYQSFSSLRLLREQVFVDRNAQAVKHHAHQIVLTDRNHEIDHLLFIIALREALPGCVFYN